MDDERVEYLGQEVDDNREKSLLSTIAKAGIFAYFAEKTIDSRLLKKYSSGKRKAAFMGAAALLSTVVDEERDNKIKAVFPWF